MNKPHAALGPLVRIVLAASLLTASSRAADPIREPPPPAAGASEALPPPPYEHFIVIPLRVHVLTATDLPELDCKLSDDDVRRIIGKVNRVIWQQAGIHFGIESIRREPAARQDEFRTWRDLTGGHPPLDVYPMLRPGNETPVAGDKAAAETPPAGAAVADASAPASP